MATQTGSIDLKAAKKAHDDASKYITKIDDSGIKVHSYNDTTQQADTSNYAKINSDGLEIIKNGSSVAMFGSSVRVGENSIGKSRSEISTSGMQIIRNVSGTDAAIANLGYGPGTNSGGSISDAPYYTFGKRNGTVGNYSMAEGYGATASAFASHAEGNSSTASRSGAHAEGSGTTASGLDAHAEGTGTTASGACAHAEGNYCSATGTYSHAQCKSTLASSDCQTALGKYNVEDNAAKYACIIGNGTSDNARSDALEVDWGGDVFLALDTSAGSGTDHDLYAAITALGWGSDVIV